MEFYCPNCGYANSNRSDVLCSMCGYVWDERGYEALIGKKSDSKKKEKAKEKEEKESQKTKI